MAPRSLPFPSRFLLFALAALLATGGAGAGPEPATAQDTPTAPSWEPVPVSGRVVDDDGVPRAGLAVILERAPLPGSPTPEPIVAISGPAGVFRAEIPEPGYWRAVLAPPPEAPPTTERLPYQPMVDPQDLGDLVDGTPKVRRGSGLYPPDGLWPSEAPPPSAGKAPPPLRLRAVAAETGRPIAGAVARYIPGTGTWARSDASGLLELPAAPADRPQRHLVVHAAGREIVHAQLPELVNGQELALEPAVLLSGRTVDASGAGLADVRVGIGGRGGFIGSDPTVRSGPDGAFALSVSKRVDRIVARHPDRAPAELELGRLVAGDRHTGLVVVVPRGLRLVGTVVDPRARPVAGATVRVSRQIEELARSPSVVAVTDGDGRFEIDGMAAGLHDLAIVADGYPELLRGGVELPAPVGSDDRRPTVDLGALALEPGVGLVGRLTDGERQPLSGVEVQGFQASGPAHDPFAGRARTTTVTTDDDGHFELFELQAEVPVQLTARSDGYLPSSVTVTPPGPDESEPLGTDDDPVLLVLSPAGSIAGRVVTATGEPATDVQVAVAIHGSSGRATKGATTDPDGRFELDELAPGQVELAVEAPGRAAMRETVIVEADGEPTRVTVVLAVSAVLAGTVVDGDGQPLAGATVRVPGPSGAPMTHSSFPFQRPEPTGLDGAYELTGLSAGPNRVRVHHPGLVSLDEELVLDPGVNRRDFRLADRGLAVSGRVVDPAGEPLAGVRVAAAPPDALSWDGDGVSTESARDGSFVLQGLTARQLVLAAWSAGIPQRHRRELDLSDGRPVDGLEIVLGESGRILGRIVGLGPDRMTQVEVNVSGPSHHRPRVGADGTFSIDDAAPGAWTVTARTRDGRTTQETVEIERSGEEVTVELDLTSGEIALTGLLLMDGEPAHGHTVHLARPGAAGSGAQTDGSGRFRITRLRPGIYRLTVRSGRLLFHQEGIDLDDSRDLTLEVETVTVSGSVVDPATGLGLADVRVRFVDVEQLEELVRQPLFIVLPGGRTDPLGRFRVGPLGARAYLVLVGDQEPAEGQVVDLSSGLDLAGLVVAAPGG